MVLVFDLDDTLYDEIDFVKSGFREVSKYLQNPIYYDFMFDVFIQEGSGKVFDRLISHYKLKIPLQKLVEIYRFHQPSISLSQESVVLLEFAQRYATALISDGHYIMQQNKFKQLGLDCYISYPLFTDFYHTHKPENRAYEMVMQHFKKETQFIYISDNPRKDFIAPKALNWIGIRYKNPIGVYKNDTNNTNYEATQKKEIIDILKGIEHE